MWARWDGGWGEELFCVRVWVEHKCVVGSGIVLGSWRGFGGDVGRGTAAGSGRECEVGVCGCLDLLCLWCVGVGSLV